MSRAMNRHHYQRTKNNRKFNYGRTPRDFQEMSLRDPRLPQRCIGKSARTPALCSCPLCGNPRKYFGHVTMAELKVEISEGEYREQISSSSTGWDYEYLSVSD